MKLIKVTKRYGDRYALREVDLTLEEGKITAVLGPSGAGKTTLLNVLSGSISFEGTREGDPAVSYLFQDAKLLPHLSAEGNLRFVLPRERWGEIGAMLKKVGLEGKEKRLPHTLSGGERQRVAIARAFLYPHDLLLMDEPFSSLDLGLKNSLFELVAALWQEKRSTVVFVTHDVREAVQLAHRAVVLKAGRPVGDVPICGTPPRPYLSDLAAERTLVGILTEP